MEILIISEDLLKEYGPIKEDTIISKFVPSLLAAQQIQIERILGIPLTEELQLQVKNNNLTPENKALILKVAPVLAHYAVYYGLPLHWASIQNKGVTIESSENSSGVDLQDIEQLKRWLLNMAQSFAKRLVEYLCRCRDNYPLWVPDKGCGCCEEETGSTRVPLDYGIYLPKPKRPRRY